MPWLESKKFLDLGCGKGIWGYLLRAEMKGETAFMVGLDRYLKNLVFAKNFRTYDDVVLADAALLPFRKSCFHISLASEIVEHIYKRLHNQFFNDVERVTSEMVVLTTPNGPWELNSKSKYDNILEYHLSAQSVSELRKHGYSVKGVGFKFLKFYQARTSKWKRIWGILFYVMTPLAYKFPRLGEFLIGVKSTKSKP